jgi:hypothetical protein
LDFKRRWRESEKMDQLGNRLADAVRSKEFAKAHLAGMHAAGRIGERVRTDQGLGRTEVSGQPASEYLAVVLLRLEQHAEAEAARSYGRYRWLWYLRRLPDVVFEGSLETTGPYNRHVVEVLATRGAGPTHAMGTPSNDGTFPLDGTAIKRIAWICGFAHAFRQYQVIFRVVGKGGGMDFSQAVPGLLFRLAQSQREESLDRQIEVYDRRNEQNNVLSNIGVPIDSYDPDIHKGQRILIQIGKVSGRPPIVTAEQMQMAHTVAMRYGPSAIPLREIVSLMAHPDIMGVACWSPELPSLISLFYLATIIYGESLVTRSQILQSGYMIVRRDYLDQLYQDIREDLYRYEPLLATFPEDASDEVFSERLLRMEGRASPLLGGPVAFVIDDELFGANLYGATRRFHDLLQFPSVQGEPANVRARAFENSVQAAIDTTPWVPPSSIRRLIGHHFKKNGKRIGEIDAFATLGRTLLIVSCKSVVYTAAYDRGEFAVVRNVRTMLEEADEKFAALVAHFAEFPNGGQEYDFTAYDTIAYVVVTPQVMFVAEPLLSKISLPGLRSYSSFEEFRAWLTNAG